MQLWNEEHVHFTILILRFRAAFQYGVKMADGRKTRRAGPKDEKAELDRQWQKIQNILKTKSGEPGGKKMKHWLDSMQRWIGQYAAMIGQYAEMIGQYAAMIGQILERWSFDLLVIL